MKKTIAAKQDDTVRRRIIDRPNGIYWEDVVSGQEFGPFATLEEARSDMEDLIDAAPEPGESLAEAEDELHISDWVDPDTGEPAEDSVTRLEDH